MEFEYVCMHVCMYVFTNFCLRAYLRKTRWILYERLVTSAVCARLETRRDCRIQIICNLNFPT